MIDAATRHLGALLGSMRRLAATAWRRLRSVARVGVERTRHAAERIRVTGRRMTQRHRDRLDSDTGYGQTLASAATAVVTTLITRPTVAAAVAVIVTGILVREDPEPTGDTEYDDPLDRYDAGTAWAQRPRTGQPLWDRYDSH